MTALAFVQPIPIYADLDGSSLEEGFVYVGVAGLNPETNPVQVYWDQAKTQPAAQPLRTTGGMVVNNGAPANFFVDGDYSFTVKNKRRALVMAEPSAAALSNNQALSQLAVSFQQDTPAVAARTLLLRLKDRWHIKDFKATGDGSTWEKAFNRAAQSCEHVDFDVASYDFGDAEEFVLNTGSNLNGRGMYSGAASPNSTTGISVINYIGSGGAGRAVVRASAASVGVEPTDPSTRSIQNVTFTGFEIAAGSAAHALYGVRCLDGCNFDRLSFTGSTLSAVWLAQCFGGSVKQWKAYKTQGSGFVLGRPTDYAGWSSYAVDETHFDTLTADYFGCNSDGSTRNIFNSTGAGDVNVGFSCYAGRGVVFTNPRAHYGDGPAWFIQPLGSGVMVNGGYMEACGRSTNTTRPFGIWYNGDASNPNTHVHFRGTRIGNPSYAGTVWTDTTPLHRIRGTAPTRREAGPIFEDMFYIGEINSSWNSFSLLNCQRDVVLSAAQAAWFGGQRSGARSLFPAGIVSWQTSAGVLSGVRAEGIATITRTGAGTFTVTTSESVGGMGYRVVPGAMPHGWSMNIARLSNTTFTITTENGGVATDPTFICDLILWSDYA